MTLTPEQLQSNWDKLLGYIDTFITGDRKDDLLTFYKKYEERLVMMPAAHKKDIITHPQVGTLTMLIVLLSVLLKLITYGMKWE